METELRLEQRIGSGHVSKGVEVGGQGSRRHTEERATSPVWPKKRPGTGGLGRPGLSPTYILLSAGKL